MISCTRHPQVFNLVFYLIHSLYMLEKHFVMFEHHFQCFREYCMYSLPNLAQSSVTCESQSSGHVPHIMQMSINKTSTTLSHVHPIYLVVEFFTRGCFMQVSKRCLYRIYTIQWIRKNREIKKESGSENAKLSANTKYM